MNASKILPGLFQGGAPASASQVSAAGFQLLVLCAREVQPTAHALNDLTVLRCPLDDNDVPIDNATWSQIWKTGHEVAHAVEDHRAVLVTCAQGLNRSGIVTGVAVHLLTGWEGKRVVEHIQRRRDGALFNQTFATAIRQLRGRH